MVALLKIAELNLDITNRNFERPFKFGTATAESMPVVVGRMSDTDGNTVVAHGSTMPPWALRGLDPKCAEATMCRLVKAVEHFARAQLIGRVPSDALSIWPELWEGSLCVARELFGRQFPVLAVPCAAYVIDILAHKLMGKINNSHPLDLAAGAFPAVIEPLNGQKLGVYYTVGGLDPILNTEISGPLPGERPQTLEQFLQVFGFRHLKVKLSGNADPDIERCARIYQAIARSGQSRKFELYGDANETAPSVSELHSFLDRTEEGARAVNAVWRCIEQPFPRAFTFLPGFEVHELSERLQVIADEALVDESDVERAKTAGYSGVALKLCKSITESLRMARSARRLGMELTMQDLTQVGLGAADSVLLAARLGITALEMNAFAFVKHYDMGLDRLRYGPVLFPENGEVHTSTLSEVGFGL